MSNRTELLALLQIDRLNPNLVRLLIEAFGSPASVLRASPRALVDEGVEPELAQAIATVSEDLLWSLEEQLTDYEDATGVRFVARGDVAYPPNLMLTEEPPLFLWVRGEASSRAFVPSSGRGGLDRQLPVVDPHTSPLQGGQKGVVAVVGSWRATPRGLSNAELIGMRLAEQGYTVVAGLGDEIDMAGLKGARDGGGRALGVLAGGIEMIPPYYQPLVDRILQRGAIISGALRPSDYPSRARADTRDDIIAGLARAVIIVEAQPEDRGVGMALRAHEAGRPVMVVQPRDDVPEGNRQLLKMGAAPIRHVGEMFEVLEEAMELFEDSVVWGEDELDDDT